MNRIHRIATTSYLVALLLPLVAAITMVIASSMAETTHAFAPTIRTNLIELQDIFLPHELTAKKGSDLSSGKVSKKKTSKKGSPVLLPAKKSSLFVEKDGGYFQTADHDFLEATGTIRRGILHPIASLQTVIPEYRLRRSIDTQDERTATVFDQKNAEVTVAAPPSRTPTGPNDQSFNKQRLLSQGHSPSVAPTIAVSSPTTSTTIPSDSWDSYEPPTVSSGPLVVQPKPLYITSPFLFFSIPITFMMIAAGTIFAVAKRAIERRSQARAQKQQQEGDEAEFVNS